MYLSHYQILCRLAFAAMIGAIFGTQRRHRKKPIGARTHVLISLAACTLAIISSYGFVELWAAYPESVSVRTDPARLMVGMLTGMGFIGAGIIYKSPHGDVKGITTAADMYLVAVLGIGAGLGLFFLSSSCAVIAYITLICSADKSIFLKKRGASHHLWEIRESLRKYFKIGRRKLKR